MLKDFKAFVMTGNVLDLAVAGALQSTDLASFPRPVFATEPCTVVLSLSRERFSNETPVVDVELDFALTGLAIAKTDLLAARSAKDWGEAFRKAEERVYDASRRLAAVRRKLLQRELSPNYGVAVRSDQES